MNEEKMKVVHDDDLVEFLKSIKEYDKIIKEEIKCSFCDNKITLENIQSIFPLDGNINYCCNSEKCYSFFIKGEYK